MRWKIISDPCTYGLLLLTIYLSIGKVYENCLVFGNNDLIAPCEATFDLSVRTYKDDRCIKVIPTVMYAVKIHFSVHRCRCRVDSCKRRRYNYLSLNPFTSRYYFVEFNS